MKALDGKGVGGTCAVLSIFVFACSSGDGQSGNPNALSSTGGGPVAPLTTGGAQGAGGSVSGEGGTVVGAGGIVVGAGGVVTGAGGVVTGAGGTPSGNGGTPPVVDGGAPPGAGGSTPVPPTRSTGCGAPDWPPSGNQTIDVDGTAREYIVKIPDGYQASNPYKLVFAWHGLGGTAQQIASGFRGGYYGLEARAAGSTIFVAGQGLPTSQGGAGWPNTGGRDVAFVRAMLTWLKSSYCIDEARIFSVGMSYGGIMSNTIGCQLGDVFRAIAPMSGSGPGFGSRPPTCVGQVAAWLSHGTQDTVVQFTAGQRSRDTWVAANHCQTTTAAVSPDPCVAYDGCDQGYPVQWCEFDGGHTVPAFASEGIWNFFSQF
jgi:polyhydroxybutyrate depolymerase